MNSCQKEKDASRSTDFYKNKRILIFKFFSNFFLFLILPGACSNPRPGLEIFFCHSSCGKNKLGRFSSYFFEVLVSYLEVVRLEPTLVDHHGPKSMDKYQQGTLIETEGSVRLTSLLR